MIICIVYFYDQKPNVKLYPSACGDWVFDFEFTDVKSTLNKLNLLKYEKLLKSSEILFCDKNPFLVQAAVFAGKDKLTFLDIREFKGNLFALIEQSKSYIKEHMDWRAELTGDGRKEIPEVPVRAIEEAIVNSLCHRDYSNPKGNEIAFFKDRIEIYNPGQFPENYDPEDFIRGSEKSILRNPMVANTLYLSKDIEKWESGLNRIYEECKVNDVKVQFKKIKSGFVVMFYRKQIKDTIKDTIKSLSENEGRILGEMRTNAKITAEELSNMLNINLRNTKKNIQKIKDKGLIKRVGSRKAGHWEVINKL